LQVFKSLSVYAFAMFFNAALSFATFSLLTHNLEAYDYGIINLYNSFTIFIVPFISIGVQFSLSVDYFRSDEKTYREHFTNAIVIPMITCVLITLLSVIFLPAVRHLLKVNIFFTLTLPLSCMLVVLNDIMLNLFRNKGKHFLFAGYSMLRTIIETGLTVLLVVGIGMTWTGRLTSALAALVIGGGFAIYFIWKWKLFSGHFKKSEIKSIALTGLPFIPERLAIFVLAYSDRFFIDHFQSTGDVGYYGAGAQIALIVNLSIISLISTFHPFIFKNIAKENFNGLRKAMLAYLGIASFVTIAVILSTPYLFKFFVDKNFQSGQIYAVNLSIGLFFWAVYNIFIAYLLYLKKNRLIMIISITGTVISLMLNCINVKHFGAIGATYTSMIVYFFMAAAAAFAVSKFFSLKKILFKS
jgi:O-antigen/teichoic acid export membrane protein